MCTRSKNLAHLGTANGSTSMGNVEPNRMPPKYPWSNRSRITWMMMGMAIRFPLPNTNIAAMYRLNPRSF